MFYGCIRSISSKFKGFFKEVSKVGQLSFEEFTRIFQNCFKGIGKKVSKGFYGSFKVVSGKYQ